MHAWQSCATSSMRLRKFIKYVLADAESLRERFDWDREFWRVEARLQVRLGIRTPTFTTNDDFLWVGAELSKLKEEFAREPGPSDERAVELWKTFIGPWIAFSKTP